MWVWVWLWLWGGNHINGNLLLCLPEANIIKLFEPYGMNSRNELVFAPGKPFQTSLLFWGKAMSLPLSGAPERCFTMVGS